jgi:hypothetical protein
MKLKQNRKILFGKGWDGRAAQIDTDLALAQAAHQGLKFELLVFVR